MQPVTGSSNCKLQIVSGPPDPASQMLMAAEALMAAVRILAPGGASHPIPLVFLSLQTIESLLKAGLMKHGFTEDALMKRPYGHDLRKLWGVSQIKGFAPALPGTNQIEQDLWLGNITDTHGNPFPLRYPTKIQGFAFPNLNDLVQVCEDLLLQVKQLV